MVTLREHVVGHTPKRLRDFLGEVLIVLFGLVVIWLGIALLLREQDQATIIDARHDTANLAQAFEQNINRTVSAIDQSLLFTRAAYERDSAHFNLPDWAHTVLPESSLTFLMGVTDRDGRLIATSGGPPKAAISLADREHFRAQAESRTDSLFISKPVLGRQSQRWAIEFSRRLSAPDGSFAGIITASVDPYGFSRFYDSINLGGGGLIVLAGLDGIVRAQAPLSGEPLGVDLSGTRLLAAAAASDRGGFRGDVESIDRFVSYRRLRDYPLLVAVGEDSSEVFALYRRSRLQYLAGGGVLSLLLLLTGMLLVRGKLRLLQSREAALRSQTNLNDAVENISQGLIMVDAQRRIPVINRRAIALLRLPPKLVEQLPDFDAILKWQIDSGEFGPGGEAASPFRRFVEGGGLTQSDGAYERTRADGTVLEVRTQRLPDGGAVRTYTDLTERKRAEAQIAFLAHHDRLTGLANRTLFTEKITLALAQAHERNRGFAVLCLDLDRFKLVNDVRGHDVGDRLLQEVADRLRNSVRDADTVARFGGDEFAIVQTAASQPEAAMALAGRLVRLLAEPYLIEGQQSLIGASIGVALYPTSATSADELLRKADVALYRAKEGGRRSYRIYERAMDIRVDERRSLEQDLREALANERLSMHYQPIFTRDLDFVGFEALIRWEHPVRGSISPAEFVPVATESGLIVQLGRWSMEAACMRAARWPQHVRIAVNVSPLQFHDPDLLRYIDDVLGRSGLAPERLTIEITEGLLGDDEENVLGVMHALKQQGVRVVLDNFGSGHSSLGYLRRYPIDGIKIGPSLVQGLAPGSEALLIVRTILILCRSLNMEVVGAGIETEDQLRTLRRLRCDLLQGYLVGRPIPPEQVPAFLARPSRPAPVTAETGAGGDA